MQNNTNIITISYIGLILSFIVPIVGLVVSVIALHQANKIPGTTKWPAIAGIIVGVLGTVATIVIIGLFSGV